MEWNILHLNFSRMFYYNTRHEYWNSSLILGNVWLEFRAGNTGPEVTKPHKAGGGQWLHVIQKCLIKAADCLICFSLIVQQTTPSERLGRKCRGPIELWCCDSECQLQSSVCWETAVSLHGLTGTMWSQASLRHWCDGIHLSSISSPTPTKLSVNFNNL